VTGAPVERLVVGLVRGLHGLRGAVRVEILTDDPARFARGSVLYLEGEPEPLTVTWAQADGPGILLRFREVPSRDAAEVLRDRYLEADATAALPDGSYYWHQVEGARVTTTDGRDLGTVRDVFRAGGGEVFSVRGDWGEVLVPAVSAVIREFAPEAGRIVVDPETLGLDEEPPQRRPRGRRTTRAVKAGVATPAPGPPSPAHGEPATGTDGEAPSPSPSADAGS
jgi:16S rRNA processing protein RimM